MELMQMNKDNNGICTYGINFTDQNVQFKLDANVEITTTVPSGATFYEVCFSYEPGASIWVAEGEDAIVPPADDTVTATNAQLNPAVRSMRRDKTLRFITSDTTAEVGVSFYVLQQ